MRGRGQSGRAGRGAVGRAVRRTSCPATFPAPPLPLTAVTVLSMNRDKPVLKDSRSKEPNMGRLPRSSGRREFRGRPAHSFGRCPSAGRRVAALRAQRPCQVVAGLEHQAAQRRRRVRRARPATRPSRPASARSPWRPGTARAPPPCAISIERDRQTCSMHLEVASARTARSAPAARPARSPRWSPPPGRSTARRTRRRPPTPGLDRRGRACGQAAHLMALARRRVVAGQFGLQQRRVGLAVRRQRLQERPAQLLVDLEPVDRTRVPSSRSCSSRSSLLPVATARRNGPRPAGGRCPAPRRAARAAAPSASGARALLAAPGRRVVLQRGPGPGVQHLQHADVRLAAGEAQHEAEELAGRQQPVTGQVPQRRPAQRARHRVGDLAEAARAASPARSSSKRTLQ